MTPRGRAATRARFNEALVRVLRSENGHFSRIWERASRAQRVTLEALARNPGERPLGNAYRRRHNLPGPSTVQRALEALDDDELIERTADGYRIAEPFLAEWILRNDI